MRFLPMLLLVGILQAAVAQSDSTPSGGGSLFSSLVPDVTISIKKHPMGADMVEISATANGYPKKLLADQIQRLGRYLNCDPRGVQVMDYDLDPGSQSMHFTKATFAVDGVIDSQTGSLRLNPFAKAFAGAENPWTVHCIEFDFEGETPISGTGGGKRWNGRGAVVERRVQDQRSSKFSGIEYRVQLLTQDPAKMDIPEPGDKPAESQVKPTPKPGTDWTTIAVFLIAAGAVGALVYSLLLRGRPAARL